MLRIIAGTHKGRKLLAPPGLETRPLPDRIKQSLFDWLGQSCEGLRVADICAGSGSFGCEAASRGAKEVHLIENGRHAISNLQANLRTLGQPPEIRLQAKAFQTVLPTLANLDLIFADPPFPWFTEQPETLSELLTLTANSIAPLGRIVIRGERGYELPNLPSELRQKEQRYYGRSWVVILQKLRAVKSPSAM